MSARGYALPYSMDVRRPASPANSDTQIISAPCHFETFRLRGAGTRFAPKQWGGWLSVGSLTDTLRFDDIAAEEALTSASILDLIFQPTFVGLTAWYTQLVSTALFTLLISLTV
jgi:hypothetical protein